MRTLLALLAGFGLLAGPLALAGFAEDNPADAEIREASKTLVAAFNAGQPKELAAQFTAEAELVDEAGNLHHGREQLETLFTKFFEKFPKSELAVTVESVRLIAPDVAVEEGTRQITTPEGARALLRYSAVRSKVGTHWLISSLRDVTDLTEVTPRDRLEALAWLEGTWVNESTEGSVKISYRWSADGNYLLGDFDVTVGGKVVMNSQQRIGWDPQTRRVRSWLFDSDGGFGEGTWTPVEDTWVVKATAVMPDGESSSATLTYAPKNKSQFTITGSDRLVGEARADDFSITVSRAAPVASGSEAAPEKKDPPKAPAPTKSPTTTKPAPTKKK